MIFNTINQKVNILQIHDEIDGVIGHGRTPKITDRPKLVYLNAVIMEVLRAASIVPLG